MVSLSRISPTRITSGILPQDGPHRVREGGRVMADFNLLNDRVAIRVLIFDRVLDGDDVVAAADVDQVEQRGQG